MWINYIFSFFLKQTPIKQTQQKQSQPNKQKNWNQTKNLLAVYQVSIAWDYLIVKILELTISSENIFKVRKWLMSRFQLG